MDGADPVAGVHGNDDFGDERHVDDDPVAVANPLSLERIREPAHSGMQLAIADATYVARLPLEYQRRLVTVLGQVHVEAVVRNVQPTVGKPSIVWRFRIVQSYSEWCLPVELLACQLTPEPDVILRCMLSKLLDVGRLEPGLLGKFGRRRKGALLQQDRHDILIRHGVSLE